MKSNKLMFSLVFCLLSGCAAIPPQTDPHVAEIDPFERFNRASSNFNDSVDRNILQPAARGYVKVTPSFVRTGIGNFFGNINDVWTAANTFLQGDFHEGMSDVMRVAINSTFGLLGFIDIASEAGLAKHRTDFGQTLGVWGVPNGPYLVIPFFGPSVVRDAVALPLDDYYGDLWTYYHPTWVRNVGTAVRIVDKRAAYLNASTLLEDAALDKYAFVRDAYLQRSASQIEMRRNSKQHRDDAATQKQESEAAKKELTDFDTQNNGKPVDTQK